VTAVDVSRVVALQVWSPYRQIIVPNCVGMTGAEADLLVLHESGWMDEVEIKISKADFRREISKKTDKHKMLLEGPRRYVYASEYELVKDDPRFERDGISYDDRPARSGHIRDQKSIIRRFFFAMPEELAKELLSEIPQWAGLLAVGGTRSYSILKRPPKLPNSRKLTDAERAKLLRYGYVRYWHLAYQKREAFDSILFGRPLESTEVPA
jgi:hypothetical protein